ncbi:FeoB-associated Cys-rich membrane protein [Anaerotignum sp. MSJ-24]|uniref:FeoB-associated Cys-rich membrane protein n=1 Tax=Anaerotignum sp. MSJ-24 TaxID=2841521 RepID=UPI001C1196E4|nr:FeoB-associated Cys-rich membrane protein [Anaerotignum sp. MSJ-24]MBU5463290.1 FeoB-associated Cys-rich membrane protein [Anaerotignum sp. MSJ-24]
MGTMGVLDYVLIGAVCVGLFFAIRYMIRHRGGCCGCSGCSGNCSKCGKCKG